MKAKDPIDKITKIVDKHSKARKGKKLLTAEEEPLLKKQQKHEGQPKLMEAIMKAWNKDRTISNKDIKYMKEIQRKMVEAEEK